MKKKEIPVLYIITKLELGGAQKICLSLFNNVSNQTFLVSGSEGILAKELQSNNNAFLIDSFEREISPFFIFKEFKTFFSLVKIMRQLKKKYKTLIVHTHSTKAGLLGRWAAFFAGIKKRIHTVHGFGFHTHQNKLSWFINYIFELITSMITTHYICVSSDDVRTALRLIPGFKKKHSIIRAAVPLQKRTYRIPTEQKKSFIVGTIACFKRQKNVTDLIKAFSYAHKQKPHLKLEIIGDGHMRPEIEQLIDSLKLKEQIILHGWQKDIVPHLARWHVFALTSLWEGLPCAIIEARNAQLPILAYDIGGIKDVVLHSENGFLYPAKKWKLLANDIMRLESDTNLYSRLASFKDNFADFAINEMINQHNTLYQNMI